MRRTAITGGHVLSMDPAIGELEQGAVLIEDDRIVAVERDLGDVVTQANASNVQTVLVAGTVVKRDGRLVGVDAPGLRREIESSCAGILERALAAGPLLPDPRPSFGDLAGPLLANFDVGAPAAG